MTRAALTKNGLMNTGPVNAGAATRGNERAHGSATATRIAAAMLIGVAALAVAGAASAKPKPATAIRAVIWPNQIVTVAPKSIRHGKVILKVKNRDDTAQQLEVNGQATPVIQPDGSIQVTVTFKKRGYYSFSLPDAQQSYANDYQHSGVRIKIT